MKQTILQEAQSLVYGDRENDYGSPRENWQRTADLINATLAHKLKEPLTASEAVLLMIQVKVARELYKPKRDNRTDIAGYAGVLDRVEES